MFTICNPSFLLHPSSALLNISITKIFYHKRALVVPAFLCKAFKKSGKFFIHVLSVCSSDITYSLNLFIVIQMFQLYLKQFD